MGTLCFDNKKVVFILSTLLLLFLFEWKSSGQVADTISGDQKGEENTAAPDTNFTFEKYGDFLKKISDKSRYIVVPLDEFANTRDNDKVVIGLRHDVDNSLEHAFNFSETEYNLGFRSTYFILHTAPYYLQNAGNMAYHTESILPILMKMQDERHFEIGWHNDLVTLQVVYNIDPVSFLHSELAWLRNNGLRLTGTASHGSPYCYTYNYLNYYFFEECAQRVVQPFVNNLTITQTEKIITLAKGKLTDFGLNYEAYFLDNNKAFSDASYVNGVRWNTGMLDPEKLNKGDRVIILVHPFHWHKASTYAGIESFSLPGQKSAIIDPVKNTVVVIMPAGTPLGYFQPVFRLSPGAYAKVSGSMQSSGITQQDFTAPVTYSVFAENRDVVKDWTIRVFNDIIMAEPGVIEKEKMIAYPNPTDGMINIEFSDIPLSDAEIEVFNINGQKILSEKVNGSGSFVMQIDLSNQPAGMYFIRNFLTGRRMMIVKE
ncbi:MAG TPA: T9SS type A sorting domain-containing protein [Bacteroidales bacterium]|nr:T9SS type A sorting domain-containing protein [Bacteroidales bacterium]